jgi:hypothetical protein
LAETNESNEHEVRVRAAVSHPETTIYARRSHD